jgi:hypothetical protein
MPVSDRPFISRMSASALAVPLEPTASSQPVFLYCRTMACSSLRAASSAAFMPDFSMRPRGKYCRLKPTQPM